MVPHLRAVATGCLTLLLVVPLAAQGAVHIVDASGAGDFTTISAAVSAAADGDTLLVRAGAYNGFSIDGKGLSIVAEVGHAVTISQFMGLRVRNLNAQQNVLLRGLDVVDSPGVSGFDSVGNIWVEDCRAPGFGMFSSASSVAARCQFVGGSSSAFVSKIAWSDTLSVGSDGEQGTICPKTGVGGPGSSGRSGFTAQPSVEFFAAGCDLRGGSGGPGLAPPVSPSCSPGGAAGNGLSIFNVLSEISLIDSALLTGQPGPGGNGCADGDPGVPLFVPSGGVPPLLFPGGARGLETNTPVREGELLTLSFRGRPGDAAFLLLGLDPAHELVPNLRGVRLVEILKILPQPFLIGPSGALDVDLAIPELGPGVESLRAYLGTLYVGASGAKQLGASSAVVLLDASFAP